MKLDEWLRLHFSKKVSEFVLITLNYPVVKVIGVSHGIMKWTLIYKGSLFCHYRLNQQL